MTPALKKNPEVENQTKNSENGNVPGKKFQEAYCTHTFFLFLLIEKKMVWKNAEH